MRSFHLGIYALFTSALMMVSCEKIEVLEESQDFTQGKAICFDAAVEWPEDYIEGRGAEITATNISSFNVWATLTKASNLDGGTIEYFSDVAFSKIGENVNGFASATDYYWPGAGPTLDFVAVGGKPSSDFTANKNTTTKKVESFTYTVPAAATSQNDVVVATATNIAGNYTNAETGNRVPLDFKHIMSAVRVSTDAKITDGTINSITFKNIKSTGTYTIAGDGSWETEDDKTDYTLSISDGFDTSVAANKGALINGGESTFMMIPQALSADAEIVVNFTHNTTNKTVNLSAKLADLASDTWTMGKITNYVININPDFTISIKVSVQPWELIAFTNEFSKTATVNVDEEDPTKDGRIKWTEGTYRLINIDGNGDDVNRVTLFDDITKPAEFKFTIAGPLGGTWKALLITKKGNPYAFTLDKTEGAVGEPAVVKIKATEINTSKSENEAELRIIVDQGAQILPVNTLTKDRINYTILQPIAVKQ